MQANRETATLALPARADAAVSTPTRPAARAPRRWLDRLAEAWREAMAYYMRATESGGLRPPHLWWWF